MLCKFCPGPDSGECKREGRGRGKARRVLKGGLNEVMCPRMKFVCCCWGLPCAVNAESGLQTRVAVAWLSIELALKHTHNLTHQHTHTHRDKHRKVTLCIVVLGSLWSSYFVFASASQSIFGLGSLCISYCVCLCVCVPVFVVYLLCFCLPKCQIEFAASEPSSGARTSW